MNLRQELYFSLVASRGQPLGRYYRQIYQETRDGIDPATTRRLLVEMLDHCKWSVPYYADLLPQLGVDYRSDPFEALRSIPILTKDLIRENFDRLKSADLDQRKWSYNTSGGSTGEPARFIQDWDFNARSGATTLLYSKLIGREVGDCHVLLWGSMRDVTGCTEGWRAPIINQLTNTHILSAFQMTPKVMREYIAYINANRPRLIEAYAESLYVLARFAEQESLEVLPPGAIITTATMLFPYMRTQIEKVFRCKVYNRYGSREVGDIGCEVPGMDGLWVSPWANYLEIVDDAGRWVPDGCQGAILITSLTNRAMPLIRYKIGDLGILAPPEPSTRLYPGQVLQEVLGRITDLFQTREGTPVPGYYFIMLLFFKTWIRQYQVVQKDYEHFVFKIIPSGEPPPPEDLDEIIRRTRHLFGEGCKVEIQFVDEIRSSASGKFRYTISEIPLDQIPAC
jgi:phenylacetate-CoA ligase